MNVMKKRNILWVTLSFIAILYIFPVDATSNAIGKVETYQAFNHGIGG